MIFKTYVYTTIWIANREEAKLIHCLLRAFKKLLVNMERVKCALKMHPGIVFAFSETAFPLIYDTSAYTLIQTA